MRVLQTGWLEAGDHPIERVPTKRTGALFEGRPRGVIHHWTGTRGQTDKHAVRTAEGIREGRGPSWHLLIARSGLIVQSAPLIVGTHHCRGQATIGRTYGWVNQLALGIELENAGRLIRHAGDLYGVHNPHEPDEARHVAGNWKVPDHEATHQFGATYHAYTPRQIEASRKLLEALHVWLPGLRAEDCALGHSDLDPERKADPGPVWLNGILPELLAGVFGQAACV